MVSHFARSPPQYNPNPTREYFVQHFKLTLYNMGIDTTTATEALEKGLDTLMDLCDVVTDKFTASRDAFNASQGDRMEA